MNKFESLLPEILTYFSNAELAAADSRQHTLSLCGRQLRITYSSAMLETGLFKAFEHLETFENTAAPTFKIFVCDENILNRSLPGWEYLMEFSAEDKVVMMYNAGAIHALYNTDSQVFSLVDAASRRGWYYLPQVARLPWYEKASPMRMLLHWWCETTGLALVHAAAVGLNSGAALLVGCSGSGKSTTAMTAVQNGFSFIGDDYVVLDSTNGLAVLSVYDSFKFLPEMLERLPSVKTLSVNDPQPDEKGYFFLHETHPDALVKKLPVKAVLLTTIERQNKTTFARLPSIRGLLSLSANSIFQMPGSGKPTLKKLAEMLRDVPVYQMSLGTNNEEIAQALRDFLSSTEI